MRNDSLPLNDPGGLGIFAVMARALTHPPFQPDFRARWDVREPASPAIPDRASTAAGVRKPAPADATAPQPSREQAVAPRQGLMERLERWFWSLRQRDFEAYLAESKDIHELEARMRSLDRNPDHPYY